MTEIDALAPYLADLDEALASAQREGLRPPPKLTLSEWADAHFYLSTESAAESGRWRTIPYQKGIMDAFTDPRVTHVSVMKSARVGWTKIVNALIGYHMGQDPCPMMVVQPTVDDAKGYSKEEVAPMLRDCPSLSKIMFEDTEEEIGPKDSGNTILHKRFPGGVLSMVGANSGAGFRRVSRRVVLFDEVDAYPPSAGQDGDQIKLGTKRAEFYWNRKIGAGSTPLIAGESRIENLFRAGDQRRFYVPCPQCGHKAPLVWRRSKELSGHEMTFDSSNPAGAFFTCEANGCAIEHSQKREIVSRGEWRAAKPFAGHASFHIWAAYSFSPNATWAQLVEEFLDTKGDVQKLKTFINTSLGETWKDKGEAPAWERLFGRRERYPMNVVPEGVEFLTCGVDVQKDRFVYEVVGWDLEMRSWSVDYGVIPADTSSAKEWAKLDPLLRREFPAPAGEVMRLRALAVDSGYNTQRAYEWARGWPMDRVIAIKGVEKGHALLGSPSSVDITIDGRRIARGYKVWPVCGDVAKRELYGWLRMSGDDPTVPGFCHFPEYGEDYFQQLTAEHLVTHKSKRGYMVSEWQLISGRENHVLDCRVYARAAACHAGLDRYRKRPASLAEAPGEGAPSAEPAASAPEPAPAAPAAPGGGFLQRIGNRGRPWLGR